MGDHLGSTGTRVGVLVSCLALLVACGGTDDAGGPGSPSPTRSAPNSATGDTAPHTSESAEPSSGSAPADPGTEIVAGDSDFGTMLFDDTGQAIYLFDVETTSEPRCYEECAEAWPPVFTDGEPVAGSGVDASLLGTVERTDGRLQVTYNDHPLYFYAHEDKFEVLCHDVFLNGGNWYVVQPGGDAAPPG